MTPLANVDAEAGYLGAVLSDPDVLVRWPVGPHWFTEPAHRGLFEALLAITSRTTDWGLGDVCTELRQRGQSTAIAYELLETRALGVRDVHAALSDAMKRRAIARIGRLAQEAATNGDTTADLHVERLVEWLYRETRTVGASDAPWTTDLEAAWLADIRAGGAARIVTGFADLDRLIEELPRGEVVIIAARPAVGKSAFATQLCAQLAAPGWHAVFASAEMSASQILARAKACQLGINLGLLRRGKLSDMEWRLAEGMPLPRFRLFAVPGMESTQIVDVVKRVAATQPVDVVVVDHLHHLADAQERRSQHEHLGDLIARLKVLAQAQQCAVVVLSQLNREADGQVPSLRHLRESGRIEEYAHTVVFLHVAPDAPRTLQVIVAKNRQGPTGAIKLAWEPECQRLRPYAAEEDAA